MDRRPNRDTLGMIISLLSLCAMGAISTVILHMSAGQLVLPVLALWLIGVPVDLWARRANLRRLEAACRAAEARGRAAEAERAAQEARQASGQRSFSLGAD